MSKLDCIITDIIRWFGSINKAEETHLVFCIRTSRFGTSSRHIVPAVTGEGSRVWAACVGHG